MMSNSKHISVILVIVVLILIEFSSSYTLAGGKVINFHRQQAAAFPGAAFDFVRIREQQDDEGRWHIVRELFACPEAYVFDAAQMKCVRTERTASGNQNHSEANRKRLEANTRHRRREERTDMCPTGTVVLLPHPLDCRRFLNCHHGQTHVQGCPDGLTFDNATKQCNWPEQAHCCEYL